MSASARSDRPALGRWYRLPVWIGSAALMLLPVMILRALDQTSWDQGDAVFLAILAGGVGIAYEMAVRVSDRRAYAAGFALAVAATLLQAWINLAVGIIGSENNPANWIYAAVLVVALAATLFARFRPLGMSWAMVAAAAAQLMAFVVALTAGFGFTGPITTFFTALWLLSAWLFRRAARTQ